MPEGPSAGAVGSGGTGMASGPPDARARVEAACHAADGRRAALRAWSVEDLRGLARRRLPRAIFETFDGGAEDESTLRDNREAFARRRLMPRVLVDVARVDPSTRLLGAPSALPIAVAPTGAAGFGRHGADVMIARAAAHAGIPYTLSTSATASIEQIADQAGGRLWFQAYIVKDRAFTFRLIERARVAGYEAVMITVDLPVGGKRERDFRNDMSIPFRYTPRNLLDFAMHPGWSLRMLARGVPVMENLRGIAPAATTAKGIVSTAGRNYDPSFDWDGLRAVRDAWPRTLIVKGIVRPDDALRALELGVDAIVVSNHGGRQLDGGIATLDALPGVLRAVAGRASVLVDGGVRRGADVVKALAMGADGVLVGRATLYGACAAGQAGALRALEILRDEVERTMRLCGAPTVAAITADLLADGLPPPPRR
ncbi:MAG: alpha-hydroxy acid oxidase [Burkholderiales bacterium]